MLTPFILVFGLILATAVIAYWSDNLGKKLGKKRVSLFGLRPRTTATLLTIASSWGIMLFTLVVLLVVHVPLRRALFSYDRERRQNNELRDSTRKLRGQVEELQEKSLSAEESLRTTQTQFRAARVTLDRARDRLAETRTSLVQAREQEATARKGKLAAERQARRASAELRESQGKLNQVQLKLAANNRQLADAKSRLVLLNQNLASMGRTLLQKGKDILIQEKKALVSESKLRETTAKQKELEKEQVDLKKRVRVLNLQKEELDRETVTLKTQRDQLALVVQTLQKAATDFNAAAIDEVKLPVLMTLAARTVPAHQTVAQVEAILAELLKEGEAVLPDLLDLPENTPEHPRLRYMDLAGEDRSLVEIAATFIAGRDEPASIRLAPERNFARGERNISARILVLPVRPAIGAGSELASRIIDGSLGDAKIFNALLNLVEIGKAMAQRAGVNPPQSPEAREFYAPGTNEQIFEVLRRIAAAKRPVRVHMRAATDLSTVDQLKVKFEISGGTVAASG